MERGKKNDINSREEKHLVLPRLDVQSQMLVALPKDLPVAYPHARVFARTPSVTAREGT